MKQAKRGTGFFTVVGDRDSGFAGGFLVLNRLGRPLEFHCTAAVKPSRAQEILYGPTLTPYLFGEQIGITLFRKSRSPIELVMTNLRDCHSMRSLIDAPLLLYEDSAPNHDASEVTATESPAMESPAGDGFADAQTIRDDIQRQSTSTRFPSHEQRTSDSSRMYRVDPASPPQGIHWRQVSEQPTRLAIVSEHEGDQAAVSQLLQWELAKTDLGEPFQRIRDAITETLSNNR